MEQSQNFALNFCKIYAGAENISPNGSEKFMCWFPHLHH